MNTNKLVKQLAILYRVKEALTIQLSATEKSIQDRERERDSQLSKIREVEHRIIENFMKGVNHDYDNCELSKCPYCETHFNPPPLDNCECEWGTECSCE